jgi:hypothetical protein
VRERYARVETYYKCVALHCVFTAAGGGTLEPSGAVVNPLQWQSSNCAQIPRFLPEALGSADAQAARKGARQPGTSPAAALRRSTHCIAAE